MLDAAYSISRYYPHGNSMRILLHKRVHQWISDWTLTSNEYVNEHIALRWIKTVRKYNKIFIELMKIGPINSHNNLGYKTIIRIHCKNECAII